MEVRIENDTLDGVYKVIDKKDKVLGRVCGFDFAACILRNKELVEDGEFIFWHVDSKCLKSHLR